MYAPETTKNAALAEIFAAANWRAAMGEMGFSFRHYIMRLALEEKPEHLRSLQKQ